MKVVFDSNVIIAAYAARAGLCHDIFELCLKNHTIFISRTLVLEIKRGLTKKPKLPDTLTAEIIRDLEASLTVIKASDAHCPECRDPDNLAVLGLLAAAQADVLISGDQDLLVLKSFGGVPIITVREFWEKLRQETLLKAQPHPRRKPHFK
jgi:putative PIN family toxin of toxin-antitoxin system